MKGPRKKIAVALSGGMDSAMAAKILKEEGCEVTGFHMKVFPGQGPSTLAQKVSESLGIKLEVVDLSLDFKKNIIEPFCNAYLEGRTPNPCVDCNLFIKFGRLLDHARKTQALKLATGHYCMIVKDIDKSLKLLKGIDEKKDQSYFLWRLTQKQLSQVLLPLGEYRKEKIRELSSVFFPFLKEDKESQEICFIDGDYKDFIARYLKGRVLKKGKILDTEGKTLGLHKGIQSYTIGQRKGLGISHPRPLYVKEIIPEQNIIIVGTQEELYSQKIRLGQLNFISGRPPASEFRAGVKIRYNSREEPAEISIDKKGFAEVIFDKRQRSATPGQSAVFYKNDVLLGGGIIIKPVSYKSANIF